MCPLYHKACFFVFVFILLPGVSIQCHVCCSSCGLQREQQAAASKHRDEVVQLTNQLSRLSGQVEKGQLAQQLETQVPLEPVHKLTCFVRVNEARKTLNKQDREPCKRHKQVTQGNK